MDINQMRYFIGICNAGSMSKAAEQMHMSQQGLSLSIRRLENELGCDLFYRKSSGLVLTEIGQTFKTEAEAILKKVDYIYFLCSGSTKKEIAVVCTTNLLFRLPLQLQKLLLNGTEDLSVRTTETWTRVCEEMVLQDEADLGIVYGDCDDTLFHVTKLDTFKQVFIVNRAHPLSQLDTVSLSDLDNLPMIVPAEGCRPGIKLRNMFRAAGITLNIAFESDRPRQTIDVVANNPNLGARIILDDIVESDLERVKVLRLKDDPFLLPICLIYKKRRKLNMQDLFLQHLIVECFE